MQIPPREAATGVSDAVATAVVRPAADSCATPARDPLAGEPRHAGGFLQALVAGYELADAYVLGPMPRMLPCRCGTLVSIDTPLLLCETCAAQLLEVIRTGDVC